MRPRTILLRADAPPPPPTGQPCNGCGLCCAAEPCPLGMVVSRRTRGRCAALRWEAVADGPGRYRCGVLTDPARHLPWLPARWAKRLVRRWIAAQQGCDADLQAT